MSIDPYDIKDICKENFKKYLLRAVSMLPPMNKPLILDIGCGSGVPTLTLSNYFNSIVYAVDTNEVALNQLKRKIERFNLSGRILVFHQSVFDIDFPGKEFDLVVAEGLLNIIGFENGLKLVNKVIKGYGYFIIHDEDADHERKMKILKRHHYRLINFFKLGEHVWEKEYVRCLEEKILSVKGFNTSEVFKNELKEIQLFREQPELFRSTYYILEKNATVP